MYGIEQEDTKIALCPCCDNTVAIEHGCDATDYNCEECGTTLVEEY